ncbi:hypothetical protein DER46DRAFT_156485 [Fusarium sp. MPI-SDFR-AT-0072]|nr:hypothetical protein DER46DRAFT_156485 [Fusarium sp. MPI-SDFR-AT-0072]
MAHGTLLPHLTLTVYCSFHPLQAFHSTVQHDRYPYTAFHPFLPSHSYLTYLAPTLHSHTPHLLHPGCSSPPPSELLPHRTCLPCGLGPLVFNNAIVPSSFSNPLLIPFRSSTTSIFVFTSQHHVRYPPHPPHLSQLS